MEPTFQLREYPVFLGGLKDVLPSWLASRQYSKIFLLTDEHLAASRPDFLKGLENVIVPPGEIYKTLSSCEKIWAGMFAAGLDRKALVINFGGGVIGDMGGFCAATYKRGVDFIQIPTTLLAMTDAAIGGKLAIDFQSIKNSIGVFRNPAAVFVDAAFLKTLPERELRSGFAEVIKHARIGDPALWNTIQAQSDLHGFDWPAILKSSIAVKVRVVEEDPLEQGLRALLNFGHTIGHAIESYFLESDTPLTHGEAVYSGMICECLLAAQTPATWGGWGTLPEIPEAAFPELWRLMQQDKKNASGTVRMAVPDAKPYSMRVLEPSREAVEQALLEFNRYFSASQS